MAKVEESTSIATYRTIDSALVPQLDRASAIVTLSHLDSLDDVVDEFGVKPKVAGALLAVGYEHSIVKSRYNNGPEVDLFVRESDKTFEGLLVCKGKPLYVQGSLAQITKCAEDYSIVSGRGYNRTLSGYLRDVGTQITQIQPLAIGINIAISLAMGGIFGILGNIDGTYLTATVLTIEGVYGAASIFRVAHKDHQNSSRAKNNVGLLKQSVGTFKESLQPPLLVAHTDSSKDSGI
jgi:hypothetical protein